VIFYTGNTHVGRVIYKAAAEHLTPCILELGGKNPVFITKTADLKSTCWKLVDAKFQNAGQFCVSPDHVLVEEGVDLVKLKEEMKTALFEFFSKNKEEDMMKGVDEGKGIEKNGNDSNIKPSAFKNCFKNSTSFGRIVSKRHWARLKAMLDNAVSGLTTDVTMGEASDGLAGNLIGEFRWRN
jgi:hypothetical protein